jgi:hypothetical protein
MQKTILTVTILSSLFLASCASSGQSGASQALLENPLYAEWYYNDLTETMMNLEIQQSPLLKDAKVKEIAADTRRKALAKAEEVVAKRQTGLFGRLIPAAFPAQGQALLLDGMLYLGPDTDIAPSGNPHVFLSPVIDPVAGTGTIVFPDASAVDLGPLVTHYGASAYALPQRSDLPDFRTAVIWDATMKRIVAYAQLRAQ